MGHRLSVDEFRDPKLRRFDSVPACDRRTNGQTDGRMDGRMDNLTVAKALCSKQAMLTPCKNRKSVNILWSDDKNFLAYFLDHPVHGRSDVVVFV